MLGRSRQQQQQQQQQQPAPQDAEKVTAQDYASRYGEDASVGGGLTRGESVSNFLYDLNAAIAPKRVRMEAIRFALDFFEHEDAAAHDEELALGAANVLLSKLAYAYMVHPQDEEVAMICTSLQRILGGATRPAVARAFDEAGKSIVPLLVTMISSSICHRVAVQKVMQVLRYFSRVLTAMVPMAHYPGLLEALLVHIKKQPSSEGQQDGDEFLLSVHDEASAQCRVDAMATIVNLACAEENKYMMAHHATLLTDIVLVSEAVPQSREHASTILMNLAYHERNKATLAHRQDVLDTLTLLMVGTSPATRRYASAALFTLACSAVDKHVNCTLLASHRGGALLECLKAALLEDPLAEARINAAEALFHMAKFDVEHRFHQNSSHHYLLQHRGLLEVLARSVAYDDNVDVRNYAARALEWLASDVTAGDDCHPRMLSALVRASVWTGTASIAEGFRVQSQTPVNRLVMVEHSIPMDGSQDNNDNENQHFSVLDAISHLGLSDEPFLKMPAVVAMEQLSQDELARPLMAQHEGVMMALTRASFQHNPVDDDVPMDEATMQQQDLIRSALKNLTHASGRAVEPEAVAANDYPVVEPYGEREEEEENIQRGRAEKLPTEIFAATESHTNDDWETR